MPCTFQHFGNAELRIARFACITAICFLLALSFSAGAASLTEQFEPGTPYYFDQFNSEQQPWNPGQHLNFEEVFKNYQYYEIVLDQNGEELTISRYIQGAKTGSEKYQVMPDGSLRKK